MERINETQDNNWKEIVEKVSSEKEEALLALKELDLRYISSNQEREDQYTKELSDLQKKLEFESSNNKEGINTNNRGTMIDVESQTDGRVIK